MLLWCISSVIAFVLITSLLLGSEIYKKYLVIPNSFLDFNNSVYYNQSMAGFLARAFENPELTKGVVLLTLILGLLYFIHLILKTKFSKSTFRADLIFWNISILYMLIFVPFAWQYHFTIAIFPLVTTVYLGLKHRFSFKFFIMLAVSYLLMGLNIKLPQNFIGLNLFGAVVLSHVFIGATLLLFINFYLTRTLIIKGDSKQ